MAPRPVRSVPESHDDAAPLHRGIFSTASKEAVPEIASEVALAFSSLVGAAHAAVIHDIANTVPPNPRANDVIVVCLPCGALRSARGTRGSNVRARRKRPGKGTAEQRLEWNDTIR